MGFQSVLFPGPEDSAQRLIQEAPDCFRDLNLDQLVEQITGDWRDYDLSPIFYTHLTDVDEIAFRHEVMQDLANESALEAVKTFASHMRNMRKRLEQREKLFYTFASKRAFLDAVALYCRAVGDLASEARRLPLQSRALTGLRRYLEDYVASEAFRGMAGSAEKLLGELSRIQYSLLIRDGAVTVGVYNGEADYSVAVEETFHKFSRHATKQYRLVDPHREGINHIESQIQDRVALLFPDTFRALGEFCSANIAYVDPTISRFEREIHFYIAYLEFTQRIRAAGLSFSLPHVSAASKEIAGRGTFDLALASKLLSEGDSVVANDFWLADPERTFVVSGPNHGGKTTFARMIGQLHYLGSLGCPVPGTDVKLFLFDRIFTHFEREEDISTARGKLRDDLVRIRRILDEATPNSLVIMNEVFSSTTVKDAVLLSTRIMGRFSGLDLLCVWVTFLDELASFNEKTVSVVSTVDPRDPAIRTFELVRKPADGLAYALAIAEKYRVTYDWLKERLKHEPVADAS
jgi:DNA mismatch repair protein MutS